MMNYLETCHINSATIYTKVELAEDYVYTNAFPEEAQRHQYLCRSWVMARHYAVGANGAARRRL